MAKLLDASLRVTFAAQPELSMLQRSVRRLGYVTVSSLLQKINNTFLNAVLFNWRSRGDFLLSAVVEVLEEGWSEIHGAEETPREFIAWKNRQPNVNT